MKAIITIIMMLALVMSMQRSNYNMASCKFDYVHSMFYQSKLHNWVNNFNLLKGAFFIVLISVVILNYILKILYQLQLLN